MKLKRDTVRILRAGDDKDSGYVEGTPAERFGMVWEITRDAWAFRGESGAEQRLQRDVAVLVRRKR